MTIRSGRYSRMKSLPVLTLLVPGLLLPLVPTSFAAGITLTRVDYVGTQLGLEGTGAKPSTGILVNGAQLGVSDSTGTFVIQTDPFKSYDCQITVTDGLTSAKATLPGCTPTAPPPTLLSPLNGAQTFLPLSFGWTDVVGAVGYDFEISQDSTFLNAYPLFVYASPYSYRSLSNGIWFWRVRTYQYSATPGVYVLSDWTPAWSFTIPNTAPSIVDASIIYPVVANGRLNAVYVQLTNVAPAGGKAVSLSSSSTDITLPASFTIPEGYAYYAATISTGHVVASTTITVTATVDVASRSASFTLIPEYLVAFYLFPNYYSTSGWAYGGDTISLDVELDGTAPAGGAQIALSSNNPSVIPVPSSITIAAGNWVGAVFTTTAIVPVVTPVGISATYKGITRTFTVFVSNATITSFTLNSASVVGGDSFTGNLYIGGPHKPECGWVYMWTDQPSIVSVGNPVWVCGSTLITFFTSAVSVETTSNIFAKFGGVTKSAPILVKPAPTPLDTVSITLADYVQSEGQLNVQATSTSTTATLNVYNFNTGELIGTLTNQGGGNYAGTFNLSVNPWKIKVVSSLGGTATRLVTVG